MSSDEATPLLRVRDLTVEYPVRTPVYSREKRDVHAAQHVSFDIAAGETLALVGESGCGKSTTGRLVLRLIEATSGRVVERGRTDEVFRAPSHPYTAGLIASTPRVDQPRRRLTAIGGSPPGAIDPPPGCAFAPRCALAEPACEAAMPALVDVGDAQWSRCRRWSEL